MTAPSHARDAGSARSGGESRGLLARRGFWWVCGAAAVAALVYLMATASTGPTDPTEATTPAEPRPPSSSTRAIIVFREGLEAVLIFAAVIASFLGANKLRRRPVVAGAGAAFGAAVVTWFVAQALLAVASPLGAKLEAITGFIAIVVLLLVLNWFVHNVYWSQWIGRHHRRRRELLAGDRDRRDGSASSRSASRASTARASRSCSSCRRCSSRTAPATVLEGVAIGLAATAVVGVLTFWLHHKLPYKRMLVLTGVLVGVVLVVMTGGTALSFQQLGWLPEHPTPFEVPGWMGAWFEIYGTWETVGAQLLAAAFVVGSYLLAEHLKVRRPRRRGEPIAVKATAPPPQPQPRPGFARGTSAVDFGR